MKIDLVSLIIAALGLASFFVPIAWYQITQKRKIKKITDDLMLFAKEHNVNLTAHEVWGDGYAIGMSPDTKKLLYLKLDGKTDKKVVLDLTEIANCKVSNVIKTIRGQKESFGVTNNIRLVLHYRNPKKGPTWLEIYDGEHGKTLTTEISVANKWAGTINAELKPHADTKHKVPML